MKKNQYLRERFTRFKKNGKKRQTKSRNETGNETLPATGKLCRKPGRPVVPCNNVNSQWAWDAAGKWKKKDVGDVEVGQRDFWVGVSNTSLRALSDRNAHYYCHAQVQAVSQVREWTAYDSISLITIQNTSAAIGTDIIQVCRWFRALPCAACVRTSSCKKFVIEKSFIALSCYWNGCTVGWLPPSIVSIYRPSLVIGEWNCWDDRQADANSN